MAQDQQKAKIADRPDYRLVREGEQVDVALNRYRLQLLLTEFANSKGRPSYDAAGPWVGVMLAFLLTLVASDFHDFLGIKANVWEGFSLFAAFTCALTAAYKVVLACRHRKDAIKTPEQIIQELMKEMGESGKLPLRQ